MTSETPEEPMFRVKYQDRSLPTHRYTRRPMTREKALARAKLIGAQDGIVGALVVPYSEGPSEDLYFDVPAYLKAHRDVEDEVKDSLDEDVPALTSKGIEGSPHPAEVEIRNLALDKALRLAHINKGGTLDGVLKDAESFMGFLLAARP